MELLKIAYPVIARWFSRWYWKCGKRPSCPAGPRDVETFGIKHALSTHFSTAPVPVLLRSIYLVSYVLEHLEKFVVRGESLLHLSYGMDDGRMIPTSEQIADLD